jgi:hypothetical protein
VVRALLPATSARPRTVDLLLCGHHYLTSREALAAAGAVVIDETGTVMDPAPAGIGPVCVPRHTSHVMTLSPAANMSSMLVTRSGKGLLSWRDQLKRAG